MDYELRIRKQFEEKKYVLLKDFLDRHSCYELTEELKKLVDSNSTVKDVQCPLSDAVHGAPVFDSLLEQLLPAIEQASGKRLHPTYAYARIYRPGEVLKVHRDRESCEISVTLNLGFEGDPWAIYMADDAKNDVGGIIANGEYEGQFQDSKVKNISEIFMDVGDAVLYRGMDVWHWRKQFKGKWLSQVFLHYVDADGPNSEWKYDKREKLSHHQNPDYSHQVITDALSVQACEKLIESLESQVEGVSGLIGGGNNGNLDTSIRNVKKTILPTYRGISSTMAGIGLNVNNQIWKFNVTHANQTEYLKYGIGGHYVKHVDTIIDPNDNETRKLTVILFLNDDYEGGNFFIENGHEKYYPPQKAGMVLIFPSFMIHGVEPVTRGIRRSIVTWMVGPWFK